jgi:hypothetical protein
MSLQSSPHRFQLFDRLRAAGLHGCISVVVAGLVAVLVLALWYPAPFDKVSGGRELLMLLITVDVVLGPAITFAVWNRNKPRAELVRDLTVVGALQLAALAYGVHTAAQARPAVIALEGSRLSIVRPIDLEDADLGRAPPELRTLSWAGPHFVAAREPGATEKLEAIDRALQGQDIGKRPAFWRPAAETAAAYTAAAAPLAQLVQRRPASSEQIRAAASAAGRSIEQLGYLPILARRTDWSALIDRKDGSVVGYVPIDGF